MDCNTLFISRSLIQNYKTRHREVHQLYGRIFGSFEGICATFKDQLDQDGAKELTPDLNMSLVYLISDSAMIVSCNTQKDHVRRIAVEQYLPLQNSEIQKVILKGIITCMMQDKFTWVFIIALSGSFTPTHFRSVQNINTLDDGLIGEFTLYFGGCFIYDLFFLKQGSDWKVFLTGFIGKMTFDPFSFCFNCRFSARNRRSTSWHTFSDTSPLFPMVITNCSSIGLRCESKSIITIPVS